MAFRGRGRGFVPRAVSRVKRQFGWTASDPAVQSVGTSAVTKVLMGSADWERGSAVSQSATLYGIRGFVSLNPQVLNAQYTAYIAMYDEGETIDDPTNIGTYYGEDILWTYVHQAPVTSLNQSHTVEVNVKVKRRITMDSALYYVAQASAATSYRHMVLLRSALRFS